MTVDLKQRIVGIGVLVFLALIILPWLFGHNQPSLFEEKNKHDSYSRLKNIDKMSQDLPPAIKPMPSEAVNLKNDANQYPSYDETRIPDIPSHQPPESQNWVKPSLPIGINAAKIENVEAAIIHAKAAVIKKLPKVDKPKSPITVLNKPDLPSSKASKIESIKKKIPAVTPIEWAIQLGSFSNQKNANKLTNQLKTKGYPVYLKHSPVNKVTKVFVGPIKKQDTVSKLQQIEQLTKIHGIIVKRAL